MSYWKEATPLEYEKSNNRITTVDGRLFVKITKVDLVDIISDLLKGIY